MFASILTTVNQSVDLIGSLAVLLTSLFGIGALVSAKHRQTLLRWQQAMDQAAAATDQLRKEAIKLGDGDLTMDDAELFTMRKALELAPDLVTATDEQQQTMMLSSVLKLPPMIKPTDPKRGPNGRFVKHAGPSA